MTLTSISPTQIDRDRFFINGEWKLPQSADTYRTIEAATEQQIGTAALGSAADIDAAVRAARAAIDNGPWGKSTAAERSEVLRKFATALELRGADTVALVSRENGMPITLSQAFNLQGPVALLRMYADYLDHNLLEVGMLSDLGGTLVRREPVGVVGAIAPWNYPQMLAMFKVAPALAAGCTVVLKPSPETALDAYVMAEAALEAGLPPGVLNIVAAEREASASLVEHPLVDKIAFTGSTAAGRLIGAKCGELIRRCTLELGGKSAAIVCDDVDIDVFLAGIDHAAFDNNSQTCTTQSRILAPRSRYDEIVDAVAGFCRDMKIGNPLDPETTCGPMATQTHLNRVLGYIEIGKKSDARLVTGGQRPADQSRGWFVEPTVFANVSNEDQLAREEVFGPVLTVIPYDDDDDAVRIANDSNYGLGGSVWSSDEARAVDIARRVRTGTVGVNYYVVDLNAPFGGMKDSGLGRESGPQGIESYFEYKSIYTSADFVR
ncbi:aldehyde dehydrogenase [Rhodococcus opacus]|uniref:aldehyde dehydrogenase n=1 Tax=Rhodococcus opacus TaxID=37919 RepID=UPI001C487C51|nr:aldehyde dehydrogenase [Rhodococcus opacus]MBV6756653.1 aldehyde dehydrogenase [Rhodococcus opacus]